MTRMEMALHIISLGKGKVSGELYKAAEELLKHILEVRTEEK